MAVYVSRALRPRANPFAGARTTQRSGLPSGIHITGAFLARSAVARGMLWYGARGTGAAAHWLTGGWRRPLVWFGGLAGGAYGLELLTAVENGAIFSFWRLVALYLLLAFVIALWRARNRVVVERFVDYSQSADDKEKPAHGLSALLVDELAELRQLYQAVDDRRALDTAVQGGQPIQATLHVEDVSAFLENAASSESKISVGPLVLPVGTVLALFGRLVQGPRLSGGLHVVRRESESGACVDVALLTAHFSSAARLFHWRVEQELPHREGAAPPSPMLGAMVSELACRMFVDLALDGSVGWRAGRKFLDGLHVYRGCIYTQRDRKLKLQRAEQCFVQALAEDESIAFAHYNLGVVYTELRGLVDAVGNGTSKQIYFSAAENAFRAEIQRMPARWEPYYALAHTLFEQGRFPEVTPLCDRVIELRPAAAHVAKAYDLKGLAEAELAHLDEATATRRVRTSRSRAVAYAYLALARSELRRRGAADARRLASRALQNLAGIESKRQEDAEGLRGRLGFRRVRTLLTQSARLDGGSMAHFMLGAYAFRTSRLALAVDELKAAVRIAPTSAHGWAALALTDARLAQEASETGSTERAAQWRTLAQWACRQALNFVDCRNGGHDCRQTIDAIALVLTALDEPVRAAQVLNIPDLESHLAAAGPEDVEELESTLESLKASGDKWGAGLTAFRLGQLVRDERAQYYGIAIDQLEDDFPEEVRRRGIRATLARALAGDGAYQAALQQAEQSIGLDPASYFEREALGDVYLAVSDFEHARDAFADALLWQPDSAELHRKLGRCHHRLGEECNERERRRQVLTLAEQHYQNALELYAPGDLVNKSQVHYALARLYSDLGEFEKLLPHARAIVAPGSGPLVDMLAGEAFLRRKNYRAAEDLLSRALEAFAPLVDDEQYGPRYETAMELGDAWPLALVLAWTHWILATSYARRGVRLADADAHAREAERCHGLLAPTEWTGFRAGLLALDGLIALRRGDLDDAVSRTEESLGLDADSEVYVQLAEAYAAKASQARTKAARAALLERARTACRHAGEADVTGEATAAAAQLLPHLVEPTTA